MDERGIGNTPREGSRGVIGRKREQSEVVGAEVETGQTLTQRSILDWTDPDIEVDIRQTRRV